MPIQAPEADFRLEWYEYVIRFGARAVAVIAALIAKRFGGGSDESSPTRVS